VAAVRGLYAIVDPEHCAGRDPRLVAEAILRGGCAALQLRAKQGADAAWLELGHELAALCRARGVPFIVNDRVSLAQQLGADGVHLGQGDLPIDAARALLGSRMMIGVSTHSLEQAADAERRGADGIGFGPIFATQTKAGAEPTVGVERLRQVCASVRIPVIAIGGITLETAAQIVEAGAPLAAAIAALCAVPDPESAARALHASLRK
jgi:thiamine-phosphate pyrophosphorylase